jgi:hypothetical protein
MSEDLTQLFAELLSQNRGQADYGVHATMPPAHASQIELVLTFKRGSRYCCAELGCHLSPSGPAFWPRLRKRIAEAGIAEPPVPLTLHVSVIVEDGAILDTSVQAGMPEPFSGYQYQLDYLEHAVTP